MSKSDQRWQITLFGGLRARTSERQVTHFRTRKAAQLLAYLALHPQRALSREALADRFWGEDTPATARQNLRAALSLLRKELGPELFDQRRETLTLQSEFVTTDVAQFEQLLARANHAPVRERRELLRQATQLCQGELLPEDDQEFIQWERARLREALLQALRQQASLCRECGEEGELRACLLRIAALDPDAPGLEKLRLENALEPPPPAARARLPRPLSRFIGREQECAQVLSLLLEGAAPLITVTGLGGMGKTRLCQEVGRRCINHFATVAFAPLAELTRSEGFLGVVAQALGLQRTTADPQETFAAILEACQQPTLLILDNAEHLLPSLQEPLVSLLQAPSKLTCLISSRLPLRIDGEQEFPLPPLDKDAAQRFFLDRAQKVVPGLDMTPSLQEISEQLDGVPLALELAAARLRLLSPEELSAQLSLDLLFSNDSSRPERHKSMRASLEGTYGRLTPTEQQLWQSLAVLSGSWSTPAAAAISGHTLSVVRPWLESLLTHAVIQPEASPQTPRRFRQLAPLREFGMERLKSSPEALLRIRQRHADYFLGLAEEIEAGLRQNREHNYARLDAEESNLQTAILFAFEDSPERLLRAWKISTVLSWSWWVRGRRFLLSQEERDASLLLRRHEFSGVDLAYVAHAELNQVRRTGSDEQIEALLYQQHALHQEFGNPLEAAVAWEMLGQLHAKRGELASAERFIREAAQRCDAAGDPQRATWMLAGLAAFLLRSAPLARWEALAQECERRSRRYEGEDATAVWEREFGWQAYRRGDYTEAVGRLKAASEKFYRRGEWRLYLHCLTLLGQAQQARGESPQESWTLALALAVRFQDSSQSELLQQALAGQPVVFSGWP